jgi:hypothetical protein
MGAQKNLFNELFFPKLSAKVGVVIECGMIVVCVQVFMLY